jgi:hypothetical protein
MTRWDCAFALGVPGQQKYCRVFFFRGDVYTVVRASVGGKHLFSGSGNWDDETAMRAVQDVACALVAGAYGATVEEVRTCL